MGILGFLKTNRKTELDRMLPAEFKELLNQETVEAIVEKYILAPGAFSIGDELIEEVRQSLVATYNVNLSKETFEVIVVGSGKLGFSISKGRDKTTGESKERYRVFSPGSDIDIAIVSQKLFFLLWKEIAEHTHLDHNYVKSSNIGTYMTWGWIRPDMFPRNAQLPLCESWWANFHRFSADTRFGRRKVRGGIFFHKWFLSKYQQQAVRECLAEEKLKQ